MRITILGLFAGAVLAGSAFGQSMISAHSGVVQYLEGDATIGDKPVELKFGHYPDVKKNEVLSTQEGRAEVLLSPGSFLRLAENTQVKMISNDLTDTNFELIKGEILIETMDSTKDRASVAGNAITVVYKNTSTRLEKAGLYEFKAEPAQVRVFEGEAAVKAGDQTLELKHGKMASLESSLVAEKFDAKEGDELTRWSSRRSSYIATANVYSAKTAVNGSGSGFGSGYGYGYGSGYLGSGGWAWNPMFGMFTYLPYGGMAYSPFGYGYWSPYAFSQYYPSIGGYYYGGGYLPVTGRTGNFGNNSAFAGGRGLGSTGFATGAPPSSGNRRIIGGGGSTGFSGASVVSRSSSLGSVSSGRSGGFSAPSGGAASSGGGFSGASAGRASGGAHR